VLIINDLYFFDHFNFTITLNQPNSILFSYFFLDEKVREKSRLQMMKGAHL